jgi:hypothetical protein
LGGADPASPFLQYLDGDRIRYGIISVGPYRATGQGELHRRMLRAPLGQLILAARALTDFDMLIGKRLAAHNSSASHQHSKGLLWVKLRSLSAQLGSPLYPQEQTSPAGPVRSEKCQIRKWDRRLFNRFSARTRVAPGFDRYPWGCLLTLTASALARPIASTMILIPANAVDLVLHVVDFGLQEFLCVPHGAQQRRCRSDCARLVAADLERSSSYGGYP